MNVLDYGELIVGTAVVTLLDGTPAMPARCKHIYITCEGNNVRWRADGDAPTSAVGHVLTKDDSISFTGADYRHLLENMQLICGTISGSLRMTYFD